MCDILIWVFLVMVVTVISFSRQRQLTPVLEQDEMIRILFRQSARWSTASTQDKNPLIATLHSNYASGYLWALEDLFTADQITRATGVNYHVYRRAVQSNQDRVNQQLIKACPQYAQLVPHTSPLVARVAGETINDQDKVPTNDIRCGSPNRSLNRIIP